MNTIENKKPIIEHIKDGNSLIFDYLGISITDIRPNGTSQYIADCDYGDIVTIWASILGDIWFTFDNVLQLSNETLTTQTSSPLIQVILKNINDSLYVLDGLRLTNDNILYFTVLSKLSPNLVVRYSQKTKHTSVEIRFQITEQAINSYHFTTKQTSIQHVNECEGFTFVYSISGDLLKNDLEKYCSRMLDVWEITEDKKNVDYKKLGILSDMLTI
jgi:hypothetical protein